ncbi:MAG: hypothetical protein L6R43_09325 [Planctomycetes bacterium]|nr:hypothetical protein [Planctomycetota bacterium]
MGRAYTMSVLGMLAMPFLLAGTIGFLLWRASRAPDAPGAGGDGSPPPPPPPPPPPAAP